jgi:hypothetical protein
MLCWKKKRKKFKRGNLRAIIVHYTALSGEQHSSSNMSFQYAIAHSFYEFVITNTDHHLRPPRDSPNNNLKHQNGKRWQ